MNKKNKIFLILFFALCIALGFFVSNSSYKKTSNVTPKLTGPEETVGICSNTLLRPVFNKAVVRKENELVWGNYHNEKWGYTVSYPDTDCLYLNTEDNLSVEGADGGMGVMTVDATTTSETYDQWLSDWNKGLTVNKWIVEKKIKVDGNDAVIVSDSKSSTNGKTILVSKGGILYSIFVRWLDVDYVVNHFSFDK